MMMCKIPSICASTLDLSAESLNIINATCTINPEHAWMLSLTFPLAKTIGEFPVSVYNCTREIR